MRSWDMRASISGMVLALAMLVGGKLAAAQGVSGFTTNSTGVMEGKVTDNDGDELDGVEVFVTMPDGSERKAVTDSKGKYKIDLGQAAGQKFVFVRRAARIHGQVLTASLHEGEEVFEIQESEKPKVMPRPTTATNLIPEYSDEAREKNVWARAWLMLDIDAQGQVIRMKMLKAPGYGLDDIAVKAAARLRFQPARSLSGKPIPSLVLWDYEWPAYYWLISGKFSPAALPPEVQLMPCQGTVAPNALYFRDCSTADVSKSVSLPWIPAISVLDAPKEEEIKGPRHTYWYEDKLGWVLAGTGAVAVGASIHLLVSSETRHDEADRQMDPVREAQIRSQAEFRRSAGLVIGAFGLVSLGVGTATLVIHTDGYSQGLVQVSGRF